MRASILLAIAIAGCIQLLQAQSSEPRKQSRQAINKQFEKQGGNFSLGLRNTLSAFNHGQNNVGYGIGGHFRIQLADRVNTEWYADILPSTIGKRAHRYDYHIGWSVMYYLLHPRAFTRKFTPFIEAGHCFDHTRIRVNGENGLTKARWSSAVQMGLGTHYNVTPKFDVTLKAQYMLHLGNSIHAHEEEDGSINIETHKHAAWEGHLLVTLSLNYKLMRLWKPRRAD